MFSFSWRLSLFLLILLSSCALLLLEFVCLLDDFVLHSLVERLLLAFGLIFLLKSLLLCFIELLINKRSCLLQLLSKFSLKFFCASSIFLLLGLCGCILLLLSPRILLFWLRLLVSRYIFLLLGLCRCIFFLLSLCALLCIVGLVLRILLLLLCLIGCLILSIISLLIVVLLLFTSSILNDISQVVSQERLHHLQVWMLRIRILLFLR
mmetsp:Transcript_8459/g.31311  ORF Transcript_8459/g.31311 Transcript_8459/m.31311 type:complete len:208 (+) Transcript_8459:2080-2703(+)